MRAPNGLKGLVLDLRNNPGGLLSSAVDVASLLVPKESEIVSARYDDDDDDGQQYEVWERRIRGVKVWVIRIGSGGRVELQGHRAASGRV